MGNVGHTVPPIRCCIGGTTVDVTVRGNLPSRLSRLTALPSEQTAGFAVRLEIEVLSARNWELTSSHDQGIYEMGRPSHYVSLDCGEGIVSFRIPAGMDENDFYWIQRDLFACLGSLSTDPLLHSSAVVHENRGYLFCASSGIGKSTVARLLSGHAGVVNDETNWVTRNGAGTYMLVNQPFWLGDSEALPFVPVAGIYLLERSENGCSVSPCALSADVFSILLAVHLPLDSTDPFLPERSTSIVLMSREVALRKLHFRRDVRELEEALYDE